MGRHRVGWVVLILLAIGASGINARASETPVYLVTGGTVTYDASEALFSFSGPNLDITFGVEFAPPGRTTDVGVTAGSVAGGVNVTGGSNIGFGTAGGISYPNIDFIGQLVVFGSATLPNPPVTIGFGLPCLAVSGPASFSGSLTACAPYSDCVGPNTGANVFILDFNNTGISTFHLLGPVGLSGESS
jgi:hypothetical protein